jgi:hypothetical protein
MIIIARNGPTHFDLFDPFMHPSGTGCTQAADRVGSVLEMMRAGEKSAQLNV